MGGMYGPEPGGASTSRPRMRWDLPGGLHSHKTAPTKPKGLTAHASYLQRASTWVSFRSYPVHRLWKEESPIGWRLVPSQG